MAEDVAFWQTRVKVTQIPSVLPTQEILDPRTKLLVKTDKSWLCDPFLNQCVYGAEITLNQSFTWIFFLRANSRFSALEKGWTFLNYLEENFEGLTGEVEAFPITRSFLNQNHILYELALPRLPYRGQEVFTIIRKIIQTYHKYNEYYFQFHILWQKDDSVEGVKISEVSPLETYKVKVFVRILTENVNRLAVNEEQISKLKGLLAYLTVGIRNIKGESAELLEVPPTTWQKILLGEVFWVNHDSIHTGPYFRDIYERLPEHLIPAFLSPFQVDFTFHTELPLNKASRLSIENINFSDMLGTLNNRENHALTVGNLVVNGVVTNSVKPLSLNHFAHSVFIAGQMGAGKTYMLGHVCKEIHDKFPDVGILILNLGKGRQEGFYSTDMVVKYGDPRLRVSYFYEGEYLHKSLQQTASYLVASLGLKDPIDKILLKVMNSFIQVDRYLPHSLRDLFKGLKKWFKEHPYHTKYQTNILRALDNRVLALLSNEPVSKVLEIHADTYFPEWFTQWRKGNTVFIDLSMCDKYVKRLISSAIFQMVRTLLPDREAGKLQSIIVIDEAHQIGEKPITTNPDDDDFISREELEKILTTLIREFRSKGLSLVFADNTPHRLFSCIVSLPSLKFLFRLSHIDSQLFTNNLDTQEYLSILKKRHALVLNGNNEETFVIKTLDYKTDF
ncbi:MAG: hypothetical protein ACXADU_06565 [Promethearchaeota archaeon]|jgi:hypothetical protein